MKPPLGTVNIYGNTAIRGEIYCGPVGFTIQNRVWLPIHLVKNL